jgi:hypothetical protein
MKRVEATDREGRSNTTHTLRRRQRRVKEEPEEGSEETNLTKNEQDHSHLQARNNDESILSSKRLGDNIQSPSKHLNKQKKEDNQEQQ